jgi:hypothetical protein
MMQTRDSTHSWAARNTDNAVVINGGRTWSVTSYLSAFGRIQATLLGVLQFVNLFDEFRWFRGALLIGRSLAHLLPEGSPMPEKLWRSNNRRKQSTILTRAG